MPLQKVDRTEILKHALILFKAKSYHNTSMADIAKSCGLQKGSIYHYFESKEHLMTEVLQFLKSYYVESVFKAAENKTDPLQQLNFLIEKSDEIFHRESGGCLMASIGIETLHDHPQFTVIIKQFFGLWIDALTTIFTSRYPYDIAVLKARQSVADIEGSVLLMQLFNDSSYLSQAHYRIINSFINT